jgi:hypothetical protein
MLKKQTKLIILDNKKIMDFLLPFFKRRTIFNKFTKIYRLKIYLILNKERKKKS